MSPRYFSYARPETRRTVLIFYEPALVIRSAGPRPALIEFITFPHQIADFLVYPWKSIPSACFPNWDEFVYIFLLTVLTVVDVKHQASLPLPDAF